MDPEGSGMGHYLQDWGSQLLEVLAAIPIVVPLAKGATSRLFGGVALPHTQTMSPFDVVPAEMPSVCAGLPIFALAW